MASFLVRNLILPNPSPCRFRIPPVCSTRKWFTRTANQTLLDRSRPAKAADQLTNCLRHLPPSIRTTIQYNQNTALLVYPDNSNLTSIPTSTSRLHPSLRIPGNHPLGKPPSFCKTEHHAKLPKNQLEARRGSKASKELKVSWYASLAFTGKHEKQLLQNQTNHFKKPSKPPKEPNKSLQISLCEKPNSHGELGIQANC